MVETLGMILCAGMAAVLVVSTIAIIAKQFIFIGGPNEILVFSGRTRTLADGSTVGYRVLFGGRAVRIPLVERVDRMDLRTMPIDVMISNAYSKGGIPLKVHAIANVKVSSNPRLVGNAIERFLGRDPGEIKRVAKETLEGHLRGVLATLTPEEVNEDRLKFATALVEEAEEDFVKLGLHLDTLKIQNVDDDVNYLASIGRSQIALVLRDAEVAESTAKSDAHEAEARATESGQVATQEAEAAILGKRNDVRRLKADMDAKARAEEERTEQAPLEARAQAEQKLQEIRRELEETRLMSDVVLPAQAAKTAAEYRAQGRAAEIAENGKAMAEVLRLTTDAWMKAGPDAKDIFLIQNLEQVLRTVVDRVTAIQVDEVTLLDGGDGDALANYAASYPKMIGSVLSELEKTTGVDIMGILAPTKEQS